MVARRKKPTYEPVPTVPQQVVPIYDAVLQVLTGRMAKAEGARKLGMHRMVFQSLCHESMSALIRIVTPGKPGRPPMSETEREYRRRVRELEDENERLKRRMQSLEEWEKARTLALHSRPREWSRPAGRSGTEDDEVAGPILIAACQMINQGMSMAMVAALLMIGLSTLRRYCRRAADGLPIVMRRGPAPRVIDAEAVVPDAWAHLEQTRGRAGAVVLSRITGGSRRVCAAVKKRFLAESEMKRKRSSLRVQIAAPGIVRSFDQLYIWVDGIKRLLLICADAFCAFRTTIELVDHYDSATVARVIADDIRRWGAPLVWRFDRASSHLTTLVLDLLLGAGVLPLCGPARYPCYYGQMERMNREHREWMSLGPELTHGNIGNELNEMCKVLNTVTIRPILEYRSAAALWADRVSPSIDRRELLSEVYDVATDRYAELGQGKDNELNSWRYAAESALTRRGLISIETGAWC
jgi:hypothetical protein